MIDIVSVALRGSLRKTLGQLWNTMQAMPRYRGTTTFMITTDHGRGGGLAEWKEHGVEEKGSENIWLAVMGPDTPALGERIHTAPVAQAGIAATLAAFMGRDYRAAVPQAAPPIRDVLAGDVPAEDVPARDVRAKPKP